MNHFDEYIDVDGKKMRLGYTTGSCAAGAAQAATIMLFSGKEVEAVTIHTLSTQVPQLTLEIQDHEIAHNMASCAVIKFSGDDPDITNGIKIYAKAEALNQAGEVIITGGRGVGRVTRTGLQLEVGECAINPHPRQMIEDAVRQHLPKSSGIKITISVPEGERIAEKTFNKKLGIEGGISILGTTGIVRPMSLDALKESMRLHMQQLARQNYSRAVLVPGNHGRNFAHENLGLKEDLIVEMSNYPGFMIRQAQSLGFTDIVILGHIGKIVKLAGGIWDTHSKTADCRMEIMAANLLRVSDDLEKARAVLSCCNTEEAVDITGKDSPLFSLLAKEAARRSAELVQNEITIHAVLYSFGHGLLGASCAICELEDFRR